jgi:hypothetical protein
VERTVDSGRCLISIYELFNELDYLVTRHFGDFEAALATERGTWLIGQLLADENRVELRRWYSSARSLNPGAMEVKNKLEHLSGEQFWSPPVQE